MRFDSLMFESCTKNARNQHILLETILVESYELNADRAATDTNKY